MTTQAFHAPPFRGNRHGLRAIFGQFADMFAAIGEALRLSRRFEELTSRGLSAQDAARKVFEDSAKRRD